jgi:hypothetical protein
MRWTYRALAMLALSLALVAATIAAAAAETPATDQNDRLLASLQAGQAERTQAALALARSMERHPTPLPNAGAVQAATPTAAAPRAGVNVAATLLLGLAGGLLGGAAAMAGWTVTTRRRTAAAV